MRATTARAATASLADVLDLPLVALGEVRLIGEFRTSQLAWHAARRPGFPEPVGTIGGVRVWRTDEVVTHLVDHGLLPSASRRAWRRAQERAMRAGAASARHAGRGALVEG